LRKERECFRGSAVGVLQQQLAVKMVKIWLETLFRDDDVASKKFLSIVVESGALQVQG